MRSEIKSETTPSSALSYPVILEIRGIGNVPSFKNAKRISINRKTGKRFPRTEKRVKDWMENAIQLIEYQLRGMFLIGESGILGECQRQSLIASSMPLDDSLDWMIPGAQSVIHVPHGNEGCTITIERLE